jgi:hypothetical protein
MYITLAVGKSSPKIICTTSVFLQWTPSHPIGDHSPNPATLVSTFLWVSVNRNVFLNCAIAWHDLQNRVFKFQVDLSWLWTQNGEKSQVLFCVNFSEGITTFRLSQDLKFGPFQSTLYLLLFNLLLWVSKKLLNWSLFSVKNDIYSSN